MQRFNRIGRLKDAIDSAADKAQDVSQKAADAAEQAQDAARKTLDATTEKAQGVSRRAADAAASAGERAQNAAGKTLDVTTSAASGTVAQSQHLYNQSLDKLFPECPVTAFMLPTGPDAEDYIIAFDLDDMFDNLKSGIFVRPKLEVWAGRAAGFDLDKFGQRLKDHFVRQFNAFRESQIRAGEVATIDLEADKNQSARDIADKASGSVRWIRRGWRLTSIGFIVWPLLPLGLIFLAIGIGSMSHLVSLIPEYLSPSGENRKTQKELDQDLKKLEAQFDSKNAAFQRAVRNIEVKVHPRIETLTSLICDVEGVAFSSASSASVNVPDVGVYLRHEMYLKQFPAVYRRLLEVC